MALTKRRSAALALAAATLTCVAVSGNSSRPSATPGGEPTLVGAWTTRIRPLNCETGEVVPGLFFRGLFTFHAGGTSSEYGIGPGQTPALRSPGHGRWQREPGWREYSHAFTFYRYDAAGAFAGSHRVRSTTVLDEAADSYTGTAVVEVLDANDNLVLTVCAAAEGTRFE